MENYTEYGINKKTYDLLFNEKEENKEEISPAISAIDISSIDRNELFLYSAKNKMLELHKKKYGSFKIKKNYFDEGYTYKDNTDKFKFAYLDKYLNDILKKENKIIAKKMNSEILQFSKRHGSCFHTSMIIASNLENSYFITSLIPFRDNTTHLHSYVLYEGYIIDYTKNLIIQKTDYARLLKAKEITRIKSEDIGEIFNLVLENEILNNTKYIATFGEEIKKDLEKNQRCLKKIKSKKPNYRVIY